MWGQVLIPLAIENENILTDQKVFTATTYAVCLNRSFDFAEGPIQFLCLGLELHENTKNKSTA